MDGARPRARGSYRSRCLIIRSRLDFRKPSLVRGAGVLEGGHQSGDPAEARKGKLSSRYRLHNCLRVCGGFTVCCGGTSIPSLDGSGLGRGDHFVGPDGMAALDRWSSARMYPCAFDSSFELLRVPEKSQCDDLRYSRACRSAESDCASLPSGRRDGVQPFCPPLFWVCSGRHGDTLGESMGGCDYSRRRRGSTCSRSDLPPQGIQGSAS